MTSEVGMGALKQYIEIYEDNRDAVHANSVPVLNWKRERALELLREARLPHRGEEDYEATDMDALFAPDFGINVLQRKWSGDLHFSCDVPNLSTNLYYVINDTMVPGATARCDKGLVVETFRVAAERHPDILEKYYGSLVREDSVTASLNTLLVQDGILIYVPRGVRDLRPVQIVNVFNAAMPMMAMRRLLVVTEEDSEIKLLVCDHTRNGEQDYLSSEVVEIVAGVNTTVDYYHLEESSERTRRVSDLYVRQESGSNVLVNGITLVNGATRNNYTIEVLGERAETRLLGMAIESGRQHVDSYSRIEHKAPRCKSDEMMKYVLWDDAVGAFAGKILVAEGCPRVEAYQGNKNICQSATARIYTKPQLEIYTDDVKCSHGATIGRLDEEALFYMQTRGVSREEARRLLMQAFVHDVVEGVRLDVLRERLHHLVERRFAGSLATCKDCGLSSKK